MEQTKVIKEIVCRATQMSHLPDNVDLIDSGLLDSFAIASLIAELERTFKVKIPGDKVSEVNFNRIDRIAALMNDLKK